MDVLCFAEEFIPSSNPVGRWGDAVHDVFADELLIMGHSYSSSYDDECSVRFDIPTPPMSFGSPLSFVEQEASPMPLPDLTALPKVRTFSFVIDLIVPMVVEHTEPQLRAAPYNDVAPGSGILSVDECVPGV